MLFEVYLGLGSNLGDRAANLAKGLELLRQHSRQTTVSSLYETAPQGYRGQPPFLNAACRLWTALDPFQLMHRIRQIEAAVGRRRAFPNSPRSLDIDLLVHGRAVLLTPSLTVPHPRMAERAFVLAPLAEIAPWLRHPVLKESVASLLARLPTQEGWVKRVGSPGISRNA